MYNFELISYGLSSLMGGNVSSVKFSAFLGVFPEFLFQQVIFFSCCLKRLPSYLKTITSRLLKCLRLPSFYLVGNWTLESLRARMGHKNELKLAQYEIQLVKLNRIPPEIQNELSFHMFNKELVKRNQFSKLASLNGCSECGLVGSPCRADERWHLEGEPP